MHLCIKKHSIQYFLIYSLFLSIFLLPSYLAVDFGGSLPMFSIQRIIAIFATMSCLINFKIRRFLSVCSYTKINLLIFTYAIVTFCSGAFNGTVIDKSWMGIVLEQILIFYLFVYFIKYEFSIEKMIILFRFCAFFLCILGIVEYIYGESFYSILQTTEREIWTGNFIRGGSYRIMGPFNHALAYGMVLIVMFPISCYDIKKEKVDLFSNWILVTLIIVNIFFTGSRSTLLVLGLELFLIFMISNGKNKLKIIVISILTIIGIAIYINVVDNAITNNIRTIMYSIVDIIFGTNLSTENIYTADVTVGYRLSLILLLFSKDINPLIGNGYLYSVGYSIDNNYIGMFIKTGWLGIISFLSIIIYVMLRCLSRVKTSRAKVIGIAVLGYCTHLFFVNELHTISILFILLAMMYYELYSSNFKH
ncbi:hypothetical protein [Clostridium butyricum]|uniref:hypothetical protein n=1 Tax=Clostridium butyricum TaxID=1492 RepID=UPI00071E9E6F|nr:hypothetical protein [Clostridium butyricum]ALS18152.1 hypothetical protein ATD26_15045 [Clostridium butyricum]MDM8132259.1 hypothetical protein [Clostridium butyricum]MDM8230704.1 hypothetical protein [Clostridium butyricum]